MNTKSFALVAVTGVVAAAMAYAVPALADTVGSELPMEQTLADNSSNSSMPSSGDNNGMQNPSGSAAQSDNNIGSSGTSSQTNTDEGTPDTATGDDDY